jgi:N utilization substance protein B
VDVAKAFYEDDATGLVNAALDAMAREAGTDLSESK